MARYARTLRARDYHVALLAAIHKEYVIACALLDERHNDPLDRLEDERFYTFGRIHQHNVIIARLPEGTVGIDASAAVAADLYSSFPSLRFGLMVGIAGGAPTRNNDIRLGDIVVSIPSDRERSGGVFQYDFGASIQTRGIVRRGRLNRPPLYLLNAVGELRARYESHGHDIEGIVEQIISESANERLRIYRKPQNQQDLLFMSDFVHADENRSCNELGCNLKESKIVSRPERNTSSDGVVVHLGTIGSGGLLMRDATLRDQIADEDGVKCFEMESAGLMNSPLDWLVIRGISDYSDSHKHDSWQNYAAAVAAVYAKELLGIVRPAIATKVGRVHAPEEPLDRLDLFRFLEYERMDYKRKFAMPEDSFDLEWVWNTTFMDWLRHPRSNKPYWVCGKPGSGKSTLMAYLSHSSRTREILKAVNSRFLILHFFYDYRAGAALANNIEGMLRMLLYQLATTMSSIRDQLQQGLQHQRQESDSPNFLLDKVCEVLTLRDLKACIFVDGLDEYEGSYVELVQTCRTIISRTGVKMCIASRPEVPVSQIVRIYSQILLQDYNASSMEAYARESILAASFDNIEIKEIMSSQLQQSLVLKAEGIILWFKLAFDEALDRCLNGSNEEEIKDFLEEVPSGLDAMYQRILSLLPQAHLHECALLLFMVQEFREGAESIDKSVMTRSSHLWGAYDLLSSGSETYLKHQKVLDAGEFHSHLKMILRGLIEVVPIEHRSDRFDVRFIHKTFAIFIDKSSWIEENLSPTFKLSYPDAFPLRLYAHLIMRAAVENVLRADQHERCLREARRFGMLRDDHVVKQWFRLAYSVLGSIPIPVGHRSTFIAVIAGIQGLDEPIQRAMNEDGAVAKIVLRTGSRLLSLISVPYKIPSEWQMRRAILKSALSNILELAAPYEDKKGSAHDIIVPALCTNLDLVIAFRTGGLHFRRHPWKGGMNEVVQKHLHLFILIYYRFTESLLQSLTDLNLTVDLREKLLTTIIHEHVYCSTADPAIFPRLFDRIVSEREVVKSHHICDLLSEGGCLADAAHVAYHLLPYVKPMDGTSIEPKDRGICDVHGSRCNLLLRWAQRTRTCYERTFKKNKEHHDHHQIESPCRDLLSLLVAYGVSINRRCYTGGTVLHAVLNISTIKSQVCINNVSSLSMTFDKFLALVAEGIDPTIKNRINGTALQTAKRSKEKLLKLWTTDEEQAKIDDVLGSIIESLEEYDRAGAWPEDLLKMVALPSLRAQQSDVPGFFSINSNFLGAYTKSTRREFNTVISRQPLS